MGRTLLDKIWDAHTVRTEEGGRTVLYIDRQYIHEVTSPVAFAGLARRGVGVVHPDRITATVDHNIPTVDQHLPIAEPQSRHQVETLRANCARYGIEHFGMGDPRQGIVHIIGPELGLTQPGMTIVCGDSHTSTHGAFGAMAIGIGTSEVEHVMATQTLSLKPFKTMAVNIEGELPKGVTAKDIILAIIAKIGTGGGQGHVIEYRGEAIKKLSMDARMTICNMSIEAGARAGMIAPDEVTFEYLKGRPHAPEGEMWDKAIEYWKTLKTDDDAVFDKEVTIKAEDLEPYVTWGTNPGQGIKISGVVPDPASFNDETERTAAERAIAYMGLTPGMRIKDIAVDTVFIGSCTNGRLEDLRVAASIMKGHHKAENIHRVLVVPASSRVRLQAEKEGLDKIFKDFGAEWRNAGCSMCLGMNPDKMVARERSISTSNRNFEGRQGKGSRTHLASPAVAAATAIRGTISSPADL